MNYRKFRAWCSSRAADGCWEMRDARACTKIVEIVNRRKTFWRREREWKYLDSLYGVVKNIVEPTNKRNRDMQGGATE